jgi:enoyl-CoA hydratase/carnithine racemase
MADELLTQTDGSRCTITLNRPEKRNALTAEMLTQLGADLTRIASDPAVRVIVVRGEGLSFCAGLDLGELSAGEAAGLEPLEALLEQLERMPQPTIAAVQGDAVAGGCELALHCDLRVAAENARFSMPLARIGLAVPITLTWKLVDTIGFGKTKEILFTGEAIDAHAALGLGMVNRVVPASDLAGAVAALAEQIAQNAPLAVRAMKAFVQRALSHRLEIPRADLEALARGVRSSADMREGLAARRERRRPVFRGV